MFPVCFLFRETLLQGVNRPVLMTHFILRQSIIFVFFFPVPIVWRQFDSSYVMALPLIQHTLEETRELAGILAGKNNKFRKSSKCNEKTKRQSQKVEGGLSRGQNCGKHSKMARILSATPKRSPVRIANLTKGKTTRETKNTIIHLHVRITTSL